MADPNPRVIKAISECSVTEAELNTFLEEVVDGEHQYSYDTMCNIIVGIIELNKLRLAKVEHEYRQTIRSAHLE